jgi:hypothetical protein
MSLILDLLSKQVLTQELVWRVLLLHLPQKLLLIREQEELAEWHLENVLDSLLPGHSSMKWMRILFPRSRGQILEM